MTPEQLEAQSRAAIKAWCDDPSVQLEITFKDKEIWSKNTDYCKFLIGAFYYRIAKPEKWYRVAKFTFGNTTTADNEEQEKTIESGCAFIKWLDERKYYD